MIDNSRHTIIDSKYNIDVPNIGTASNRISPVAKYVMITKVKERRLNYKNFKRIMKKRIYGVGILTDKNEYYFNLIYIKSCDLNANTASRFMKTMTTRFTYTKDTSIQISENIGSTKEPIYVFLRIVANSVKAQIRKTTSYLSMLKALNRVFCYIVPKDKRNFQFSNRNRERMLRKLIEHDRFAFIRDPEWRYSLSDMDKRTRAAHVECAVGILYMHIKSVFRKNRASYIKRKSN